MTSQSGFTYANSGNKIANRMIGGGIVAVVIAAIVWLISSRSYDPSITWLAFWASISQLGLLVAILGLHALAVRAPRS